MKTEILTMKLADLVPTENNPRQITKDDFDDLKKSIKEFPEMLDLREIVIDENNRILGGHQRVKALIANGETEATVKRAIGLTERQKDEFVIRDNVQNGEWDEDILANSWNIDDLTHWGLKWLKPFQEIVEDDPAPLDDSEPVSEQGAIYKLGDHRIYCGSFADSDKLDELFDGNRATCTFTDPPYNVAVKSRSTGKTIKNDSMSEDEFQDFLDDAMWVVHERMVNGGGVIAWMSDKEIVALKDACDKAGIYFRTLICWVKDTFTLGGNDFQSAKEVAVYGMHEGKFDKTQGKDESDESSELAVYGRGAGGKFTKNRNLSNVWFFDKPRASKDHPTMKPVGLCAKGVLAMSDPGDIVFDPFSGSGSTLIACEQTGRKCYGCELDPRYCDVIRKRYWKFKTGSEEGWQEGTNL